MICIKVPGVSISYLIGFLTFEQWLQSKSTYFIYSPQLVNYSALVIVIFGLIGKILQGRRIILFAPGSGWIYLLYAYALSSMVWSPSIGIASDNIKEAAPYLLMYLFLANFLMIQHQDFDEMEKGIYWLLVPLALLCVFFADWSSRVMEPAVFLADMKLNPLAVAVCGGILFAFAVFNSIGKSLLTKAALYCVAGVALFLVIKTESRGQLLALLLLTPVFLLLSSGRLNFKQALATAILSSIILISVNIMLTDYSGDIRWDSTRMQGDYEGRLQGAANLMDAWLSSPGHYLFGLGLSASYQPYIAGTYVHIVPLEVLGELGLAGLALYLVLHIVVVKRFFRTFAICRKEAWIRTRLLLFFFIYCFTFLLTLKQGSLLGSAYQFFYALMFLNYAQCCRVKVHKNQMVER